VLKRIGNVLVCPERMHRSGTTGERERESQGELANPGSPGRMFKPMYVVCL